MTEFLGTINGPWKCESHVSLQPEALEKAKADANQTTEPVSRKEKSVNFSIQYFLF
jgi:hypothetical protein